MSPLILVTVWTIRIYQKWALIRDLELQFALCQAFGSKGPPFFHSFERLPKESLFVLPSNGHLSIRILQQGPQVKGKGHATKPRFAASLCSFDGPSGPQCHGLYEARIPRVLEPQEPT